MKPLTNQTTLLLVDDDPSMVRLLTQMIERSVGDGVEVVALTDPTAAQERIEAGGIDILLTDLEMPEIDGLAMLRTAKQRDAHTQVLFITGAANQEALLEAMESGATDYLIKPVKQQLLGELIQQAQARQLRWRQALGEIWHRRQLAAAEAN